MKISLSHTHVDTCLLPTQQRKKTDKIQLNRVIGVRTVREQCTSTPTHKYRNREKENSSG